MTATTNETRVLGDATVAELAAELRGNVICPGDPGYDDARALWNAAHDKHPALIVQCAGPADVAAALRFARSEKLEVAVRGGGHSIAGFSGVDGGLVIDLSSVGGVLVDPVGRRAIVQGGCTWRDVDLETQIHGLATTGGLISTTGVGGFTLGGGIGWLMRRYGLACDNLVAADVVTADGEIVHASETENPKLLWALRGGGGNFGVVTSFEFALHEVGPTVAGGAIFFPGEDAGKILCAWRAWLPSAPDELTTLVSLATAPPAPFIPEAWHGKPIVIIPGLYAGSVEDGEKAMRPLRELGEPIADLMGPLPYVGMQSLLDPLWAPGAHNYFKAGWLRGLDDRAIETIVAHHRNISSPKSEIHVHHMGGAVARVPAGATAFGDRSAPFLLNIIASTFTADGYPEGVAWAREFHSAMDPALTGGTYVNFATDDAVHDAYGADTYERLVALKREYDPTNLFGLNQNVRPD